MNKCKSDDVVKAVNERANVNLHRDKKQGVNVAWKFNGGASAAWGVAKQLCEVGGACLAEASVTAVADGETQP